MLLCNGFGCNQRIWQYILPQLATQYQLVLFDYVGIGGSDPAAYDPQRYASLAGYAQDVVDICQALNLQQVVLVGHSVGATIAMRAAIKAPLYFTKVVLLAASPYFLNEDTYYGGFAREDMESLLGLMEADFDTWASMFAGVLIGPNNGASLAQELALHFCSSDSTLTKRFAQVAFLDDSRSLVPQLQLPTLLVQCSQDVAAPAEVGAYLLEHLPQGTLVTLAATGHCPHLSAPLEMLEVMEAFLRP